MDHIRDWLEASASPVIDRHHDREIDSLARQLAKAMHREGKFFSIRDSAALLQASPQDMPLIKERVYELALRRVLKNFNIGGQDRAGLGWIGRTLGLAPEDTRRIELRVGRRVFEEYLMFAIAGGYLDQEELQQLQTMAASLDVPTRELLLGYLNDSGQQFLKRLVEGMAQDGQITDESWERLMTTVEALGVNRQEFLRILRLHGKTLADSIRTANAKGVPPPVDVKAVKPLLLRLAQPVGMSSPR